MSVIFNEDQKREALKKLVRAAASESVGVYRRIKNAHGPEFEPNGFVSDDMDALVSLLQTTDAIFVLHRALNCEED